MPLGMEGDLSPGHTVLDGDPAAPRPKWHWSPLFSAHVYCGHGRPSQLLPSSCTGFMDSYILKEFYYDQYNKNFFTTFCSHDSTSFQAPLQAYDIVPANLYSLDSTQSEEISESFQNT